MPQKRKTGKTFTPSELMGIAFKTFMGEPITEEERQAAKAAGVELYNFRQPRKKTTLRAGATAEPGESNRARSSNR